MNPLWLVSGERGNGKTTFCQRMAQEWRTAGRDVAGVLSPAVFDGGVKIGIDVIDLRSGERRRLANLRQGELEEGATPVKLGWRFDPAALAWGSEVLAQATPCDLLVVDELGPLEFEYGQGWLSGMAALDGGAYELALAVIRPNLLDKALSRWPWGMIKPISRAP